MQQIIKQRKLLWLLLTFTSVAAFRHIGWMLYYEQLLDYTRQSINLGFILYSAVIMITALMIPFLLGHFHIDDKAGNLIVFFILTCGAAFLLRLVQLFFAAIGASIFMVLWTAAIMVCFCICYMETRDTVPKSLLGRFIGIAYFFDAVIVSFVEVFSGTSKYYTVSMFAGLFLCVIAIISYVKHKKTVTIAYSTDEKQWVPTVNFVRLGFSILIVYAIVAGMMDNLYFFDDSFQLPFLSQFTLPMTALFYLFNGYLFDKVSWKVSIPFSLVFICIAQSMIFFTEGDAFSRTHSIFFNFGATFLELSILLMPICYARSKKDASCLAAMGEGIFYGAFSLTSILFLFIREPFYQMVMGIVLLLTIVCLLLIFWLISMYDKDRHQCELERNKIAIEALEEKGSIADTLLKTEISMTKVISEAGLTKREKELLPLIISSLTAEEIAAQANVGVSTIRFHTKNILHKTDTKNRRELTRIYGHKPMLADDSSEKILEE